MSSSKPSAPNSIPYLSRSSRVFALYSPAGDDQPRISWPVMRLRISIDLESSSSSSSRDNASGRRCVYPWSAM
jgi:hypothetical protein